MTWLERYAVTLAKQEAPPKLKDGPRQCCAEFARVYRCDGKADLFACAVCRRSWYAPCQEPS